MEATITLHDDDFTLEFFHKLKAFVKGKEVVISVREEEESINEYLLREPAYAAELKKRIDNIENCTTELVEVKLEDLL
jgi:hypothetical protein